MYYNQELKQLFLNNVANKDSSYYPTLFNKTAPFESAAGRDLCAMNKKELTDMLSKLCGYRMASDRFAVPMRAYITWCINNHVPGAAGYIFEIDVGKLSFDKIKSRLVASPAHLQMYLNSLLHTESQKTSDDAIRCVFWLAYGGVLEEDILNISAANVNLSEMIITYGGRAYEIYREAVPAFKNCMECTSFTIVQSRREYVKDRYPSDALVRTIAKPTISLIRTRIANMNKGCSDMRISYSRAWLSGAFYRMFESERTFRIKPNFTALAAEVLDRSYPNISDNEMKSRVHYLSYEYMRDYERWKTVYKI